MYRINTNFGNIIGSSIIKENFNFKMLHTIMILKGGNEWTSLTTDWFIYYDSNYSEDKN